MSEYHEFLCIIHECLQFVKHSCKWIYTMNRFHHHERTVHKVRTQFCRDFLPPPPPPLFAKFVTSSLYLYISVRFGSDPPPLSPPPRSVHTLWIALKTTTKVVITATSFIYSTAIRMFFAVQVPNVNPNSPRGFLSYHVNDHNGNTTLYFDRIPHHWHLIFFLSYLFMYTVEKGIFVQLNISYTFYILHAYVSFHP